MEWRCRSWATACFKWRPTRQNVVDALSVGYRMIDTAQAYQNEEGVRRAIRKSGVPREDVFVVDKI